MPPGDPAKSPPGASFVAREALDICRWTFVGDISGDEMRRLFVVQKAVMTGAPHLLLLIDLSRVLRVSPEARKVGAANNTEERALGTAIFGASFHVRMLATLVTMAGSVLRKLKSTDSPVRFFETEREALTWLSERRAEIVNGPSATSAR
jgi:SpoIIAA-like